jgi:pilus assembly protein TadC
MDTTDFDRQLGDLVWMLITGMRAGYTLQEVFEWLSNDSPDPIASACKDLTADLQAGLTFEAAFAKIKKKIPSPYLAEVITALQASQQVSGDPFPFLEPVCTEILEKVGSDKAFSEAMRRLATAVGAHLPDWID